MPNPTDPPRITPLALAEPAAPALDGAALERVRRQPLQHRHSTATARPSCNGATAW
jgi:hypothetical protein